MQQPIKYYLAAYNFIAFCAWLAYGISFVESGFELTQQGLILLNIAQGMALLEILHTLLKWVKSPVGSTAAQVFSRLLVLVVINYCFREQEMNHVCLVGICIVTFAWTITELVRYSFYFLGLYSSIPPALLWMRYSFFIVLYPLGVTGEWLILLAPVIKMHFLLNTYSIFMGFVAIAYIYYFPVLYKYMWKQRQAKLAR